MIFDNARRPRLVPPAARRAKTPPTFAHRSSTAKNDAHLVAGPARSHSATASARASSRTPTTRPSRSSMPATACRPTSTSSPSRPQGSAFVTAYSPVQASLASAGGSGAASRSTASIQEIDIHTGLVMWEWHSLGHVGLSESYSKLPRQPPTTPFDYFHINSLDADRHGNLLVSARNTWALYEINAAHAARSPGASAASRRRFALGAGVRVRLPAQRHLASRRRHQPVRRRGRARPSNRPRAARSSSSTQAARPPRSSGQLCARGAPLTTGSQGNVQALPGGGWMVGWGGLPNFTEFDAARRRSSSTRSFPRGRVQLPRLPRAVERPAERHRRRSPPRTSGATTPSTRAGTAPPPSTSWQLLDRLEREPADAPSRRTPQQRLRDDHPGTRRAPSTRCAR